MISTKANLHEGLYTKCTFNLLMADSSSQSDVIIRNMCLYCTNISFP